MADLSFKQKIFKSLYGMGMKNFGAELLGDLRKGSPAWTEFARSLFESNDYATRKVLLKQVMNKTFLTKSKRKEEVMGLLLEFLANKHSIADEKKAVLKFVSQNIAIFPTDDDFFKGKILACQRETDVQIGSIVADILPKIGIDFDDKELYR